MHDALGFQMIIPWPKSQRPITGSLANPAFRSIFQTNPSGTTEPPLFTTKVSRLQGFLIPLTEKPAMTLQKVVHRKPVPFQPHAHIPSYLLVYVIETLACGHDVKTFPQCDPLIAVRRDCKKCDPANVLEFPKKPCSSVPHVTREKRRAA